MRHGDVEFERLERSDAHVLAINGEVDLSVAGRFAKELAMLIEESNGTSLVDLAQVHFMDSSGIRELLKAKWAAESKGGELALLAPSESCRRVLEISGAWDEFTIKDDTA